MSESRCFRQRCRECGRQSPPGCWEEPSCTHLQQENCGSNKQSCRSKQGQNELQVKQTLGQTGEMWVKQIANPALIRQRTATQALCGRLQCIRDTVNTWIAMYRSVCNRSLSTAPLAWGEGRDRHAPVLVNKHIIVDASTRHLKYLCDLETLLFCCRRDESDPVHIHIPCHTRYVDAFHFNMRALCSMKHQQEARSEKAGAY